MDSSFAIYLVNSGLLKLSYRSYKPNRLCVLLFGYVFTEWLTHDVKVVRWRESYVKVVPEEDSGVEGTSNGGGHIYGGRERETEKQIIYLSNRKPLSEEGREGSKEEKPDNRKNTESKTSEMNM